jgi:hypothetical protein
MLLGTEAVNHCRAPYNILQDEGCNHKSVTHSIMFAGETTGTHTISSNFMGDV